MECTCCILHTTISETFYAVKCYNLNKSQLKACGTCSTILGIVVVIEDFSFQINILNYKRNRTPLFTNIWIN